MDNENPDEFMERMILNGAVQFAGLDEDGEMLYNFTPKLAEVDPELNDKLQESIYKDVQLLWIEGFVEFKKFDTDNPIIYITEKALDPEALGQLDRHYRQLIELIKEYTRIN